MKMTWHQLKNYIEEQSKANHGFLEQIVCVYDYEDGEEHTANIVELLEERSRNMDSGWVSYLTINDEVENDQIKETSFA
jgi:hypothetical protein